MGNEYEGTEEGVGKYIRKVREIAGWSEVGPKVNMQVERKQTKELEY
jgi:hypothetical protein